MKHGKKPEKMYDSMPQEPEAIYPYVTIPMACLEGKKFQPGDKVSVELFIEIKHMSENDISGDLHESELDLGEDG